MKYRNAYFFSFSNSCVFLETEPKETRVFEVVQSGFSMFKTPRPPTARRGILFFFLLEGTQKMIKLNPARLAAAQKPKEILNLAEAAAFMGCSPQTLRRHAKSGAVPCLKMGRFVRFNRKALEALTMGETFGAGSVQTENERNLEQ